MERIGHYIGGKHVPGESGRRGPVYDPATGEQTHEVDFADVAELNQAVEAAKEALPAWRATSLSKRAEIMFAIRELLDARKTDVATVLTSQHGKVLSDAMGEVQRGLESVEFACGDPAPAEGRLLRAGRRPASTCYAIRQPLGVVAGITPFNFPAMVPLWMCANAIACGNAFILKPSEKDPSRVARCSRSCAPTPGCPTACSTSSRATRSRSTRSSSIPTSTRGQLRRFDPDRAVHLRERHGATASACRRSAARRTTWSCCPTPTWTWRPTPRSRPAYGSAGERCMAISVLVARRQGRGPADRRDRRRACPKIKVGPGLDPSPRWAR